MLIYVWAFIIGGLICVIGQLMFDVAKLTPGHTMSILVVAEHNNQALNPATLNTITAAAKLGGDIDVLVAGHNCKSVADAAAQVAGVKRVIHADDAAYAHALAENMGNLIAHVGKSHSHIVAPASFFGKNVMPRVAAMLDAVDEGVSTLRLSPAQET